MNLKIVSLLLAVTMAASTSAHGAMIKFDVNALSGFFTSTPLRGSFVLDTETQLLSDVDLTSGAGAFDSGAAIDNASGFGLADTSFFFTGAAKLLFEVSGFNRFMPGLNPGQSTTLNVFVSQGDEFNDDFQNSNIFSPNSDVFQGRITATRANAVPAPTGFALLAIFFAGFAFTKRRS